MPTSSIARPSKVYTIWYFWFEKKASGNPAIGANEWKLTTTAEFLATILRRIAKTA
jgi:hypothetical protein